MTTQPTAPTLTDDQCDEFRRLPLSFNDMVRAIYVAGRASLAKEPDQALGDASGPGSLSQAPAIPIATLDPRWEGAEEWMPLAWELCADESGEEACTELIWEGGPIPEPWGDRWLKYEDQAKEMIAMVRKLVPGIAPAIEADAQRAGADSAVGEAEAPKADDFDWTDVRMELEAVGRDDLSAWVGAALSAHPAPEELPIVPWNGGWAIRPAHEAADAFWAYWRENGETHRHGYYESTWGAINQALRASTPPKWQKGEEL